MERERRDQISYLYQAALARPAEERGAFLKEACARDESLRHEVESLLGYEDAAAEFLEVPVVRAAAAVGQPSMIGRHVGAYAIVAPLGVGGMGEVYRAHDTKLRRDVAIKNPAPAVHGRSRAPRPLRARSAAARDAQSSSYRRDLWN